MEKENEIKNQDGSSIKNESNASDVQLDNPQSIAEPEEVTESPTFLAYMRTGFWD